jgi:hypothetical protein
MSSPDTQDAGKHRLFQMWKIHKFSAMSVLGLLAVLIGFEICFHLLDVFGSTDHGVAVSTDLSVPVPGEIYYRYSTVSLLVFFISVCIFAILYSANSLFRRLQLRISTKFVAICSILSIVLAIIINWKLAEFALSSDEVTYLSDAEKICSRESGKGVIPIYFLVGKNVICQTIASGDYYDASLFFWFRVQWNLIDAFAAATTIFLIGVGISTQISPKYFKPQYNTSNSDQLVSFYAKQKLELDYVLYMSSAVLVIGIVHLKNLLSWPIPFVVEDSRQDYINIVTAFVSIEGVFFAMIIAAGFLPLMYGLRQRVEHVLDTSADAEAHGASEKWLEDRGWRIGSSQRLFQVASVVAPFFAGPAAQLLTGL